MEIKDFFKLKPLGFSHFSLATLFTENEICTIPPKNWFTIIIPHKVTQIIHILVFETIKNSIQVKEQFTHKYTW